MRSDLASLFEMVSSRMEGRRSTRWLRDHPLDSDAIRNGQIEAVVYFADDPVNLYQMRQWHEPLARLAETHPTAVIARAPHTARLLRAECPLPVVFLPQVGDMENWLATQRVSAAFYVNQNVRNFQMMRHREPVHVFLSHGESEKDYMASNQLKAYDLTFVAGDAARERIAGRLLDFDVEARTVEIGRPQVDVHYQAPQLPDDSRTTVLYAPTWEGDRPSMTYSSLVSHAPAMLAALVATGRHRVIYRPHPRTGVSDTAFRTVHDDLVSLLKSANASDATAGHMIDTESSFGWHLQVADVAVADVSAVAFDWLATGKPLVLTLPSSPDAAVDPGGIASVLVTVTARGAAGIVQALEAADDAEHHRTRSALVSHYFGDVTPGSSMTRWLTAASQAITRRAKQLAERATPAA